MTTYLLVDGENLDGVLGGSILNGRPLPEQRPRWDAVRRFVEERYGETRPLFFVNAGNGIPTGFVQALLALGWRPILLKGEGKVIDLAILKMLRALVGRSSAVVLGSHDADFADELAQVAAAGATVAVLAFNEFVAQRLRDIEAITIFDLEDDAKAFTQPLPRLRVIDVADFDPELYL
jgi:uncharacterized protein